MAIAVLCVAVVFQYPSLSSGNGRLMDWIFLLSPAADRCFLFSSQFSSGGSSCGGACPKVDRCVQAPLILSSGHYCSLRLPALCGDGTGHTYGGARLEVDCCAPICIHSGDKLVVALVQRWIGAYQPHRTCSSFFKSSPIVVIVSSLR